MTASDDILGLMSPGVCMLGNPLPNVMKYWVADNVSCALWGGRTLYGQTPQHHYIQLFKTQYALTLRDYWPQIPQGVHWRLAWAQYAVTGGYPLGSFTCVAGRDVI